MTTYERIDILSLLQEPILELVQTNGADATLLRINLLIDDMTYNPEIVWNSEQMDELIYSRDILDLSTRMGIQHVLRGTKQVAGARHVVPEVIECVPVDDGCPICLSNRARLYDRTPCGHLLCHGCSKKHFQSSTTCPMCRGPVQETTRVRKQPKNANKKEKNADKNA